MMQFCKLISAAIHDDDDYLLYVIRPDGSQLKILIPREGVASYPNDCIDYQKRQGPVIELGLNFVTKGHYT